MGRLSGAGPWLAALLVGLWITATRNTLREAARRTAWTLTAVAWLGLARTPLALAGDGGPSLALHFLDVGQGDAAVIRTPAGHWILVDAGPAGEGTDAGRRVVAPFLQRQGARSLTLAVVSHAQFCTLPSVPVTSM